MEAGLGRPSTLPSHVLKIQDQKVLGKDFRPNEKGNKAISRAPEAIRSPLFTKELESILNESRKHGMSVEQTIEKILSKLPEPVRGQMEAVLAERLPGDAVIGGGLVKKVFSPEFEFEM
jgi:DNA topoisomerase IA